MRLSSLRRLLDSDISAMSLRSEVASELSAIRCALQERGRVAQIPVGEDFDLLICRADIVFLCNSFLQGELDAALLSFIADVIQLAERVSLEDSWIADAIAECTDPEIQGEFTAESARSLISRAEV